MPWFNLEASAFNFRAFASINSRSSGVGIGFNEGEDPPPVFIFGGAGGLTSGFIALNCFENMTTAFLIFFMIMYDTG